MQLDQGTAESPGHRPIQATDIVSRAVHPFHPTPSPQGLRRGRGLRLLVRALCAVQRLGLAIGGARAGEEQPTGGFAIGPALRIAEV